jgi:transketolase
VNGNDLAALLEAFDNARSHPAPQPRVILLDTRMGKGVPFLEAREKNHFMQVSPAEWQQAIDILDATHKG